jgi:hypothetical protein
MPSSKAKKGHRCLTEKEEWKLNEGLNMLPNNEGKSIQHKLFGGGDRNICSAPMPRRRKR